MNKLAPISLKEAYEAIGKVYSAEVQEELKVLPISRMDTNDPRFKNMVEVMKKRISEDPDCELDSDGYSYEFEDKEALTWLMVRDVISHINNHWWEEEWPKEAQATLMLGVNVGDTFIYACSDSEEVNYTDIKSLLLWSLFSPKYGPVIWASIKRNEKPLVEWIEWMESDGIPFSEWAKEWDLPDNECNKVVPRW